MDQMEIREKRRMRREYMREHWKEHHKPNFVKRAVFGLMVLFSGVLLLAKSMGYLPVQVSDVIFTWPMLLVALGFVNLFGRGFVGGVAMLIIGFYFLPLEPLGLTIDVKKLIIPIGLIITGLCILVFWRRINPFCHPHDFPCTNRENNISDQPNGSGADYHNDFIEDYAVFGGAKHMMSSNNFRGGRVFALFGGAEIDMTRSKLATDGYSVIRLACIFGGVNLTVPEDWDVEIRVISILGGFGDKRHYQPKEGEARKKLYIKGIAFLGGGEIKTAKQE